MDTIKFKKKNTLVVAHRGLSGIEKENTNSAFVAAGNRSYYGIETDIYKTADGQFVCSHDETLARVSGENVEIEKVSLSLLENVVLFDKDGTKNRTDLRPCSVENYISICKKYDKHCILEIKSDLTNDEIKKLVNICKNFKYLDNITFISFGYENLVKLRKLLPKQSIQYLFADVNEDNINKAISSKLDVDVAFEALTKDNIKKFHDAGIKVNCWTVDDPKVAEKLVSWGVDYITSNILE